MLSPGSPSHINAVFPPSPLFICLSKQLYVILSLPSLNHLKKGALSLSSTVWNGSNQFNSDFAKDSQNWIGLSVACFFRFSYCSWELIFEFSANFFDGGKILFSSSMLLIEFFYLMTLNKSMLNKFSRKIYCFQKY